MTSTRRPSDRRAVSADLGRTPRFRCSPYEKYGCAARSSCARPRLEPARLGSARGLGRSRADSSLSSRSAPPRALCGERPLLSLGDLNGPPVERPVDLDRQRLELPAELLLGAQLELAGALAGEAEVGPDVLERHRG